MPVEATRVKGELRKLFPKVNLTTKRLDELSARLAKKAADDADDAAITQLINDANEYYPFAEIAKDDDRVRTLEQNRSKSDEKKDEENPNPDPNPGNEDEPKWLSQMTSRFDKLLTEVEQLKKDKVITSKRDEARKIFSTHEVFKNLDEDVQNHYLDHLKYDSETPLEDQVTRLGDIVKKIVQVKADTTELPGGPPKGGTPQGMSNEAMDVILKNIKA